MSDKTFVYVGTWTVQAKDMSGGGIGIYEYEKETGALSWKMTVRTDVAAGKLCVSRKRGVLYCIDEVMESSRSREGEFGGRVMAFSIDPETGTLRELGQDQSTFGTLPAYLVLDETEDWLVVCNHGDDDNNASMALYPIGEDGSILEKTDLIWYPNRWEDGRKRISCMHYAGFADDGRHFIATNMKQDEVLLYELDRAKGRMLVCDRMQFPADNFPHYGVFHPSAKYFYLNHEHAHVLDVLTYDDDWKMKMLQRVDVEPQLQQDMTGKKVMQTDLAVSGDGHYLYDLFRGPRTIWVFAAGGHTGLLRVRQEFQLEGIGNLRGCAISPDGRFLIVADTDEHQVITLAIQGDGTLKETGIFDGNLRYPANVTFYQA